PSLSPTSPLLFSMPLNLSLKCDRLLPAVLCQRVDDLRRLRKTDVCFVSVLRQSRRLTVGAFALFGAAHERIQEPGRLEESELGNLRFGNLELPQGFLLAVARRPAF